jgi:hypothetical protein
MELTMAKRTKKPVVNTDERNEDEPTVTKDDVTLSEFIQTMHEPNYSPVGHEKGLPTLEWLKETFQTKSATIRYLISQGHAVKDIAKHLNIRYQQVRNVSMNELKRGPNEDWRKPYLANQPEQPFQDPKHFKPEED